MQLVAPDVDDIFILRGYEQWCFFTKAQRGFILAIVSTSEREKLVSIGEESEEFAIRFGGIAVVAKRKGMYVSFESIPMAVVLSQYSLITHIIRRFARLVVTQLTEDYSLRYVFSGKTFTIVVREL